MQDQKKSIISNESQEKDSIMGLLVRLIWMALGYLPLLFSLIFMIKHKQEITKWSLVYWASAILIVAVRYIDYKIFHGLTADSDRPATIKDVARFALKLFISAAFFYVAIRLWIYSGAKLALS